MRVVEQKRGEKGSALVGNQKVKGVKGKKMAV